MRRYLKFVHNVNHIPKVCIVPNMTMLGLIRFLDFSADGHPRSLQSVEGFAT
jgi:hypothetical protein